MFCIGKPQSAVITVQNSPTFLPPNGQDRMAQLPDSSPNMGTGQAGCKVAVTVLWKSRQRTSQLGVQLLLAGCHAL